MQIKKEGLILLKCFTQIDLTELAYVFTVGPGKLLTQGRLLLHSIQQNTSATRDDVYIYITNNEEEQIPDADLEYFQSNARVETGPMPNPDYPLSAAHGGLVSASNNLNHEYLLLLDADTIVTDDITIMERNESDLFIKPVDKGNQYWGDAHKEWHSLYNEYGFNMPEDKVESTADGKKIYPYFNGAVILTKNNNFPSRWLDLDKQIYGTLPSHNAASEQISLSLLSSDYDVCVLNESHNFPLHLHLTPSPDSKIIHYNKLICLLRASVLDEEFGRIVRNLSEYQDIVEEIGLMKYVYIAKDIYDTTHFRYTRRNSVTSLSKKKLIDSMETAGIKHDVKSLVDYFRK